MFSLLTDRGAEVSNNSVHRELKSGEEVGLANGTLDPCTDFVPSLRHKSL